MVFASPLSRTTAVTGLLVLLGASCLPYPAAAPPELSEHAPATLYENYTEDGRYFTPWQRFDVSAFKLIRWFASANPYDKPWDIEIPKVPNDGSRLSKAEDKAVVTWVGHSTFAIHDGSDVIVTDPHFGKRALIPGRWVEPGLPIESIPADAMAVISHNHYDHLDAWTVEMLPDTVRYFVPLGLAQWFRERGRANVVELGWWQSAQQGDWKITCLPSQHWSRRIGQPQNSTLWCSWMLENEARRYYFAGDTGYFHGFKEFGAKFGPIDVAMMPIGAYEPRWFMRYQHMDPTEAWQAFQDLGARYMLPMHWGTFDLTDEPVDEAPRVLERVLEENGADPTLAPILAVGEEWTLPERD